MIRLQFDGQTIVPFGTRSEAQGVADWAAECDDVVPEFLKFFEEGESSDLVTLALQIDKALATHPPESPKIASNVAWVLRMLKSSQARSVDLVEDEADADEKAAMVALRAQVDQAEAGIRDLSGQVATLTEQLSALVEVVSQLAEQVKRDRRPKSVVPVRDPETGLAIRFDLVEV